MEAALNRQVLVFLLLSVGAITLPHATHIPPLLFGFFMLLLAWRLLAIRHPGLLPGKTALLLLTLSGIGLLYAHKLGIFGRDAGTALFVTALGLKLLEIKTQRDIYLCVFLAFIVAATQFLYLQNIFMAAYSLAVSCVLIATLICVNSGMPDPIAALRFAAALVIQALPLAIIIFVFFPRVEAPRWMMFQDKHKARSGLSDSMEPGSIGVLAMSDELAFRVKFEGARPPRAQLYWRGPVYSYTDGKRWSESKDTDFQIHLDKPQFQGKPYRYTLLMEPQEKKWVYALDMPAEFPADLKRSAFYQLLATKNPERRAEYGIVSYPRYNTGYLTKTEYRDNVQLPGEPTQRIRKLVGRLQGYRGDPEAFIGNILDYFRTNAFYYTLQPPLMDKDPVETFLFATRRGFCSHYATAFVYLLRTAGIPARVVGGYQGGELNTAGNFLEIRQANAHTWAEVWLDKHGWVRVDPTAAIAPQRIEQDVNVDLQIAEGEVNFTPLTAGARRSWLKQAGYLWSNVDYQWQRWVINYNSSNQSKLLEFFNITDLKILALWLAGISALITLLLARLLLRMKGRRDDKAALLYARFCRKLAKKGLDRKSFEGALDFAARAVHAFPKQTRAIEDITATYIALRYGKNPEAEYLQRLRRSVRRFRT